MNYYITKSLYCDYLLVLGATEEGAGVDVPKVNEEVLGAAILVLFEVSGWVGWAVVTPNEKDGVAEG